MLPEIQTAIPGPKSIDLAKELGLYESRNVTFCSDQFPVFWERAEGVNVWDVDGNRFLDLTSGFGVSSLGFNAPWVVQAAQQQLCELHHAMGDVHPARVKVELCRELSRWTFERWGVGRGKTILTSSGAEAVEAALKTAYLATQKSGVLTFHGAYHGLGYGALTVSGLSEFRSPFRPQLAEFSFPLPFPTGGSELDCSDQILRVLESQEIGAILVEPIQGRGGVVVPPDWFLPLLRRVATERGILLIVDEIYTGFFRTGARFAVDAVGVIPDLICLGKALTNGFPLAACVGRESVMDAWPISQGEALHTSTFLGNPLGCRMALAALQELTEAESRWQIGQKGRDWQRELERLNIGLVRGRGLLLGMELASGALAGNLITEGLQRGLILLSGGPKHNILTLTPPFPIQQEEISWATRQIQEVLSS